MDKIIGDTSSQNKVPFQTAKVTFRWFHRELKDLDSVHQGPRNRSACNGIQTTIPVANVRAHSCRTRNSVNLKVGSAISSLI